MNDFVANLAIVLAHSVWYERARQLLDDGLPTGLFRNDMSPDPVQRDMGKETAQQYALQEEYAPKFGQINRQETEKYLFGDGKSRGFLDIYTNDIAPKYAAADRASSTAQRENDIADVTRLGRSAMEAYRGSNPQQTALLDQINADTSAELAAGYGMTEAEKRLVSESTRTSQADRGMGYGPADVYEEALNASKYGTQRHAARVDQAYKTATLNQATAADPFQLVLSRASGAGGTQLLGMGNANATSVGNQLFDFGGSLLDFNANSEQAARIAKANNNAALASAGIQAAGDAIGGVTSKY